MVVVGAVVGAVGAGMVVGAVGTAGTAGAVDVAAVAAVAAVAEVADAVAVARWRHVVVPPTAVLLGVQVFHFVLDDLHLFFFCFLIFVVSIATFVF